MTNTAPSGFTLYGGADVSDAVDASGAYYLACFARAGAGTPYAFHIFRDGSDLPISPRPTGRGQLNPQFVFEPGGAITITYTWVGWTGNTCLRGEIPGFAPFILFAPEPRPGIDVEARLAAVEAKLALPAEAPTPLYEPDYTSDAELTGTPGLFVRFNKLKAAVVQLRRLAKERGELG